MSSYTPPFVFVKLYAPISLSPRRARRKNRERLFSASVKVEDRESFRRYLAEQGVGTDIHYETPPHRQPCYQDLRHGPIPVTERLAAEVVSLPITPPITSDDARIIADIINRY